MKSALSKRLLLLAAALILVGATAPFWSDSALIGTFARMIDSLGPHLIIAGLIMGVVGMTLGKWQRAHLAGGLFVIGLLAGTGLLALRHISGPAVSTPPAGPTNSLDIIWFNAFQDNPTPPGALARAIRNSGADLVVLAEARRLRPFMTELAQTYPWQIGCSTRRICEIMVLSRQPFPPGSTEIIPSIRPQRLMRFETGPEGAPPLTVIAAHLPKPWFYGFIEEDRWYLYDRIGAVPGPLLVMGDFNSADWSRPMRLFLFKTGLSSPGGPVATWPVWAGRFGVPIDHMLVRGDAWLEDLRPWGADLGSNHRGLRAQVIWPKVPD